MNAVGKQQIKQLCDLYPILNCGVKWYAWYGERIMYDHEVYQNWGQMIIILNDKYKIPIAWIAGILDEIKRGENKFTFHTNSEDFHLVVHY